jgi:hypothetical protein
MNIDQEMLQMLQQRRPQAGPVTIGDFARRFGASRQVIVGAARRLVAGELAEPSMVDDHGISTLHGLLPIPPA